MWPRRTRTALACSIRALPIKIRTQPLCSKSRKPSPLRNPRQELRRQSASEAVESQPPEGLSPPVSLSPSESHYFAEPHEHTTEKDEMKAQGIQIPGLTLLNSLTPHAIAPTSEGSLFTPAAPQSPAKAPYVLPRKTKENKKAKARRVLEEAQARRALAEVQAATAQGQTGVYNSSNFNNLSNFNLDFTNPPYNSNFNNHNHSNFVPRPAPAGPRSSSSSFNHNNKNYKNNKTKNLPRDERVAPSAASGGIPNPTPLYLANSLRPPSPLAQPRRILVIMDLNGTLLYRPNKRNPFNFIQRPHARQFLDYCVDTFHVAVWSSARPENVDKMVSQLLSPAQRARCLLIWGRDRFGLSPADYSARVQCYKRLSSVWNDPQVAASHPDVALGRRWDQTNTVLVDDSAEKGRSEPYNILQLPEFEGLANEPPDVLPQVHDYLNALCHQANISSYIRERPFRINPNYRLPSPPDFHGA